MLGKTELWILKETKGRKLKVSHIEGTVLRWETGDG